MPTPVEDIKFVPVRKELELVATPICGPPGITKDDIRLACKDGWLTSDEVRLFGVDVKPTGYRCDLPEDEEQALRRDEDFKRNSRVGKALSIEAMRSERDQCGRHPTRLQEANNQRRLGSYVGH